MAKHERSALVFVGRLDTNPVETIVSSRTIGETALDHRFNIETLLLGHLPPVH